MRTKCTISVPHMKCGKRTFTTLWHKWRYFRVSVDFGLKLFYASLCCQAMHTRSRSRSRLSICILYTKYQSFISAALRFVPLLCILYEWFLKSPLFYSKSRLNVYQFRFTNFTFRRFSLSLSLSVWVWLMDTGVNRLHAHSHLLNKIFSLLRSWLMPLYRLIWSTDFRRACTAIVGNKANCHFMRRRFQPTKYKIDSQRIVSVSVHCWLHPCMLLLPSEFLVSQFLIFDLLILSISRQYEVILRL